MKRILYFLIILLAVGCQPKDDPTPPKPLELNLTHGKITYYGNPYDSIPLHVVALDLYSDGIKLDSAGYMHGTGSNLYLSDIFIPLTDTCLTNGTYRCEMTTKDHTFLPGMDFDGNPTGTYLLQLNEDKVAHIILMDNGQFNFQTIDTPETPLIQAQMTFTLMVEKTIYNISFNGTLTYEQRGAHL